MMLSRLSALRRDESGFAMIVAVVLLGVMGSLMALTLTVGAHSDTASGRGRNNIAALHAAESGVEEAIARLQETNGAFAGTFTGTINQGGNEGNYSVTVTHEARKRYRIDAVGEVGTGAGLKTKRKLEVTMAPPSSFKYALFSYTTVSTKNNDVIEGDVWANQNVIVELGNTINGSVTAATGYVIMKGGSRITGDVWTGGFDPDKSDFDPTKHNAIFIDQNSFIEGTAKASVTAPTDPVTCGGENADMYHVRIRSGSNVAGNVTTWGEKSGSGTVGPPGIVSNHECTAAPAAKPMPTFTYSDLNYDAATLHEFGTPTTPSATAVADFQTYVDGQGKRISGTFYINQAGDVNQSTRIDLTNVVITGDTTIITNTPIFSNGVSDDADDAIFVLVSTYQPPSGALCDLNEDSSDCTVHLKNNFQPNGDVAVLVYAPFGPVAIKNNAEQSGAVYADDILVKNNQEMEYDGRVERVVGFGPETYEIQRWLELNP